MTDTTHLEAKVLLLEHEPRQYQALMDFCAEVGLVALPRTALDAVATLGQHKDLGGVLLAEDLPCEAPGALELARLIHKQRPELPIFLRRTSDRPLSPDEAQAIHHSWKSGSIEELRAGIERSIFSLRYPTRLVQGIIDLTCSALGSMFPHAKVTAESPYVVHDRIIYGQVSTLIPLEATWCRGYMMLQTEEHALRQGLIQGLAYEGVGGDLNFREINNLLGEITNLIWGAFKNRYVPDTSFEHKPTQVPIVINHEQKYISFGSQDPQLCIRYQLADPRRPGMPPQLIVQRMIFNLFWSPETFAVVADNAADNGPTGELELF